MSTGVPPVTSKPAATKTAATEPATATEPVTDTSKPTFPGFYVPPILSWRNPTETGILLAETLGLFLVLSSPLSLRLFLKFSAYLIGLLSLVELGSRSVSGKPKGLVTSYQPSRFLPFTDSFVHDVANYVAHIFSRATFGIQHLLDARDPSKGLKLAGAFYVTYILLCLLPLKSLILTAIILTFSLPPLYLQFKPEVDRVVSDLQAKLQEHKKVASDKIYAKAGPHIEKAKKFFPVAAAVSAPASASTEPTTTATPAASKDTSSFGAVPASGAVPSSVSSSASKVAGNPEDAFKNFDSVPTLAGNIPIDQDKLSATLAANRAKAEGAVNGL